MFYTRGKGFNPSIFCHVPPLQRPSDEDPNADQSMCLGQSFEGGKGVSKNSSDSENWSAKFTMSYVSLLKLSSCIWPLSFSRWQYPSFFLGILVESVDHSCFSLFTPHFFSLCGSRQSHFWAKVVYLANFPGMSPMSVAAMVGNEPWAKKRNTWQ